MLKRLLLAVALAASTLLITGTTAGAAQASGASICAPQHSALASSTAGRCEWRGKCYWCKQNGHWERQYCRGG